MSQFQKYWIRFQFLPVQLSCGGACQSCPSEQSSDLDGDIRPCE